MFSFTQIEVHKTDGSAINPKTPQLRDPFPYLGFVYVMVGPFEDWRCFLDHFRRSQRLNRKRRVP
jgi:hypothetical protein